jgi:dienelactone hydrolase
MGPERRARKYLLLAALFAVALAALAPFGDVALTFRLLLGLQRLAAGQSAESLEVVENRVRRTMGGQELEGVLYRPFALPGTRGIILVPGISELGCNHPRLVALSRILAGHGFVVLTPDIKPLREFQIAPEAVDQISFWFTQIRSLQGTRCLGRVGLAGISFSGTLALIAAAQPENRGSVAFVLAVGPYSNMVRCARGWFAAGPVTVPARDYPTRYYARWIIMLESLDLLPGERDRQYLHDLLMNLLLQKDLPKEPPEISKEAARWSGLARAREDESNPPLAQEIIAHLSSRFPSRLTPDAAAAEVACPVFLAHGEYDDLIPPGESLDLRKKITRARTYLVISPFLTHTHPAAQELALWARGKASFDLFTFLYSLVRATR